MQAGGGRSRGLDFEVHAVLLQVEIDDAAGFKKAGGLTHRKQTRLLQKRECRRYNPLEVRASDEENIAFLHIGETSVAPHFDRTSIDGLAAHGLLKHAAKRIPSQDANHPRRISRRTRPLDK